MLQTETKTHTRTSILLITVRLHSSKVSSKLVIARMLLANFAPVVRRIRESVWRHFPLSSFFLRPHSVAAVAWPSGRRARADGPALYGREEEGEPPYSFPSHSIPRIPFRPGIEWRRNRVRPFPDHKNKNTRVSFG